MKEKFVNSSLNFIQKYQTCDDFKIIQLKYGLEGIYGLFVKLIVVLIISLLTNTIKETSLFLFFYLLIRTCSYGLHAKNNFTCWLITITMYNILPIILKQYTFPPYISYIVIITSLISMALWAPADTPKKPLIREKNRRLCKTLSIIIVIIFSIIYFLNNIEIINNAIIYALIIQNICINPITYKITKTQFNNYKYYKKKIK